jgi:hypothetical protein
MHSPRGWSRWLLPVNRLGDALFSQQLLIVVVFLERQLRCCSIAVCLFHAEGMKYCYRKEQAACSQSQVGRLACTHCGFSHQSYLSLSFCARSTLLIPHKASLFIFPSPTLNITFFSWLCVSIFRQRKEGRLLYACACVQRLVLYTWLCA